MTLKLTITDGRLPIGCIGDVPEQAKVAHSARRAFSLVELLVTMTLLSLIVLVLMAVFSSTQRAFRASVTQTDILEGSRAAVDLIASDLRSMTPSGGYSNWVDGAVNFFVLDNDYNNVTPLYYQPLPQSLPGSTVLRSNLLNYFFILGRENMKWTGVGYAVVAKNDSPMYPLYRFYAETNINNNPYALYNRFITVVNNAQWTNMSRVLDGVVNLTVRAYDKDGIWLTNGYSLGQTNRPQNTWFAASYWGEIGCYCFSNTVPAAVDFELGVLEDRTLQRASSLGTPGQPPYSVVPQWNYLTNQSGHVHLFRQRVTIPNVDPAAYQ